MRSLFYPLIALGLAVIVCQVYFLCSAIFLPHPAMTVLSPQLAQKETALGLIFVLLALLYLKLIWMALQQK